MPYSLDPGFVAELRVLSFLATVGESTLLFHAVAIYLLPTYIALARHQPHRRHITTINLAWGWTIIGWIHALLLATGHPTGPASPLTGRPDWPSGPGQYPPAAAPEFYPPGDPSQHRSQRPSGRTSTGATEHDNRR